MELPTNPQNLEKIVQRVHVEHAPNSRLTYTTTNVLLIVHDDINITTLHTQTLLACLIRGSLRTAYSAESISQENFRPRFIKLLSIIGRNLKHGIMKSLLFYNKTSVTVDRSTVIKLTNL